MPGDWMSVSTTATRLPCSASAVARLAEMFDLPVPPRKEWTEMILDMAGSSSSAGQERPAQLGGPPLQVLEVVRLHNLRHCPGLLHLVDLDAELRHLGGEP